MLSDKTIRTVFCCCQRNIRWFLSSSSSSSDRYIRKRERDFCRSLNSLLIRAEIFNAILLSFLSLSLVRKFDSIGPVYNYILFFSSLLHQSHLMIINSVRRWWWQRHSLGLPELPLLSSSSIDKERRERKIRRRWKI